jgi:hypothetical protein
MGGNTMKKSVISALALVLMGGSSAPAFYTNIVVDGSFADWASVPVVAMDASGDDGGGPDLAMLQVANDETNVYLHVQYHAAINPNASPSVMLAVDNDGNLGTGFDVFGLGFIGSEAGWQNDFPFQQTNGVFNSGTVSGGAASIAPYFAVTTEQEYAIRLDALFDSNGSPVFPAEAFDLLVYTDPTGANETMGPIDYTLSHRLEEPAFLSVTITNVLAFRVSNSSPLAEYRLESGAAPAPATWTNTGFRTLGNGGDLLLYDPMGFATTKAYRVVAEY